MCAAQEVNIHNKLQQAYVTLDECLCLTNNIRASHEKEKIENKLLMNHD